MCFVSVFAAKAQAGDAYLVGVYVERVTIVARAGAHKPGNLELKIKNGFALPSGLSCDTNYLATKDTTAGFPYITALSMLAYDKQKPVTLILSDSPEDQGFPGRCSIVAVSLM